MKVETECLVDNQCSSTGKKMPHFRSRTFHIGDKTIQDFFAVIIYQF